ncbi:flagellar protein FlaG [Massilia aurea]|uniref:flagellar protein FlaG n=1 Tax=Massilia aurea TaxID=373040 RepID=UPI003461D8B1
MQIQPTGSSPIAKLDERPATVSVQAAPAQRAAPEKTAAEPGRDEVTSAVKKLNEALPQSAQSLEFEIDEDSKEVVVKIIDRDTREVVRQMPTKEALEMAKSIDKMMGRLLDQTA